MPEPEPTPPGAAAERAERAEMAEEMRPTGRPLTPEESVTPNTTGRPTIPGTPYGANPLNGYPEAQRTISMGVRALSGLPGAVGGVILDPDHSGTGAIVGLGAGLLAPSLIAKAAGMTLPKNATEMTVVGERLSDPKEPGAASGFIAPVPGVAALTSATGAALAMRAASPSFAIWLAPTNPLCVLREPKPCPAPF